MKHGRRRNAAAGRGPRRCDVLLPHQPRPDRPGQHAAADVAPTPRTPITIPNGPGGTVAEPEADHRDGLQHQRRPPTSADATAFATTSTYLDTDYKGIEFTATKRFSKKWQMQAGFTLGKNKGGVLRGGTGPERPEQHPLPSGIVGNDSEQAFRLSGSYTLPWDINLSGSMVANNGYPYVSTYSLTRAVAATAGHHADPRQPDHLAERAWRRALRQRDDARHAPVEDRSASARAASPPRSTSSTSPTPTRSSTTTSRSARPTCCRGGDPILSPRIIRIGFSLNF